MTTLTQERNVYIHRALSGGVGGIAGGVVFGAMMGAMGMLPMVAGLVGSSSAIVGFSTHIVISIIIGVGFGLTFGSLTHTYAQGTGWGVAYGALWWVLGPLVLMPLMMGAGLHLHLALTQPKLMSLIGHLLFGLVAGVVYVWYTHRQESSTSYTGNR